MLTVRVRLGSYVAAAVGGAFTWSVGSVDVWGSLAAVALLVAFTTEVYSMRAKPERTWYEGRAAAESAKTLSWRYMVGGEPFGLNSGTTPEADLLFAREIQEIFSDLDELSIAPVEGAPQQITDVMRGHRQSDLEERKALYDLERIEDQRTWYAREANRNTTWARTFEIVSLVLQAGGVAVAALKAFEITEVDLLGIVGAFGGAILSWSQARQYRSLASAYSIAAQELATIRSLMPQERTEDDWARFVDESEEAISREHTLWRASRGVAS
jgi:hypothetical protein